jgi:Gram-negative bacterial TonB protein C-terminal
MATHRLAVAIIAALATLTTGCRGKNRFPPLPTVRPVPWSRECLALKPVGLRVNCCTEPARVIRRVEPVFPSGIRLVSGVVIIGTIIDSHGNVCDVHVMKGLTLAINRACRDAVLRWRFRPAMLNGIPRAGIFYLAIKVGTGRVAGRQAGE